MMTNLCLVYDVLSGPCSNLVLLPKNTTLLEKVFYLDVCDTIILVCGSNLSMLSLINEVNSADQASSLWKQKSFIYMLGAYTIIMGAQCAIITLLAQILIPPFKNRIDEKLVGLLGAVMLFVGFPASISVGYYLDRTLKYSKVCVILSALTALSVLGLYLSTEAGFLSGVVISW